MFTLHKYYFIDLKLHLYMVEANVLHNILENSFNGYWDWKKEEGVSYLSPAFKLLFGYEDDELDNTYSSWQDIIFPKDLNKVLEAFSQHINSHGTIPLCVETRCNHKEDYIIWVIIKGSVIEWGLNGEAIRIAGSCIDITDSKNTADIVKEEEYRYKEIFNNIQDVFYQCEIEGDIIDVSPSVKRMLGYTYSEAIGVSILDVYANPAEREEILRLLYTNGEVKDFELTLKKKDGSLIMGSLSAHFLYNDQKEPVSIEGMLRDISAFKKIEEALSIEQQLFHMLMDNAPDRIYFKDCEGRFTRVNKSKLTHHGMTEMSEIIGKTDFDLNVDEARLSRLAEDEIIRTGKSLIGEEERGINPDGSVYYISTSKVPLFDKEGKVVGIFGISRDITEHKLAEEEVKRLALELRSLSAHLQDIREEERVAIAREIHDELGQNLAFLKMDIIWVAKHLDDDRSIIDSKLNQLKEIADNTVQVSRKLYNSLHPSMLKDMGLVSTIQWHANSINKSSEINININSNIKDSKLSSLCHHICLGLFRIYQETLTNVLHYASASNVIVTITKSEGFVSMVIEDDGVGFEVKHIDTKVHHGILGMRERAYALNGKFNITSTIGKGTKTEVTVPIQENDSTETVW